MSFTLVIACIALGVPARHAQVCLKITESLTHKYLPLDKVFKKRVPP